MAKQKAAVPVGELVRVALLKAADAGEVAITGKEGLFTSAAGANKDAIAECKNAEMPLLVVLRKEGKAEIVTLTRAGYERIAGEIPEEKVGTLAKRIASDCPLAARIEFIQSVIGRTPLAAAELTPVLEAAIAAEKVEQAARVSLAAKRREAEEVSRKALERALHLLRDRRQSRVDALRRELDAEGEEAEEPIVLKRKDPTKLAPDAAVDNNFRRDVATQLAASWRATWEMKNPDAREFLESAMWNITGFKLVGEVGQRVAYSGRIHESVPGIFSGDQVKIVRPGWALEEDAGEFVVLKAVVEK